MELTFLEHSGFMVETDHHILIFDYYRDPAGKVAAKRGNGKKWFVFSSHNHGDHFNPAIAQWQNDSYYFLSHDIAAESGTAAFMSDKISVMAPYETCRQATVTVKSFGSTDAGISFLVEVEGHKIFHAGDLNWWHWNGDTPENIKQAAADFAREMEKLKGESFDVAFFPVDSRLEEYRTLGVETFCRDTDPKLVVAMHAFGPVWEPPTPFCVENREIPLWIPKAAGETFIHEAKAVK
ncbi:MAG: MBL fold metallo-hydrolase [Sporomusaceae bacterium]|nr:MBL fold metallo-hydrolase [Sporomusaceae bacterium]